MRDAISFRSGRRFCSRSSSVAAAFQSCRAIEIDLRIRIERLHARGDFVRVGDGAVGVEHLEVHAQRAYVVGETLREIDERLLAFRLPTEPRVDARELLEELRLIGHLADELAQRVDRFDEPMRLGVVEQEPRARVPELRIALRRARHEVVLGAVLHVVRIRGVLVRVRRSGFEHVRRRVLGLEVRGEKHARDIGHAFDVREVRSEIRGDGVGRFLRARHRIERVRIGEHHGRHDRVRRARVGLRREWRGATIGIEHANRGSIIEHARDDAVTPCRQVKRDAEALPNPPLAEIAHEHGRVVDDHGERRLNADDDVALALDREEAFDVEDAARRLFFARDHARGLLALQDLRRLGAQWIGGERLGPRARFFGVEHAATIGRTAATERAGEAKPREAAARFRDEPVEVFSGDLGAAVRLRFHPVGELRFGAPADDAGVLHDVVEERAVIVIELRDVETQRLETMNRVPSDERRLVVTARSRSRERRDVCVARRARMTVRFGDDTARGRAEHRAVLHRREPRERAIELLRIPTRRERLGKRPPPDEITVARRRTIASKIDEPRRGRPGMRSTRDDG
jgi:hypothetical protein